MLRQIKDWVIQYVRSVLESTVRTAVVSSTDQSRGTVRVRIPDDDDLISYDLRVLSRKTHRDKDYWMPDVGEHVLCLFLPYGLEQGFVLGAFYSQEDQPPVSSQDKWRKDFEDGAYIEYDRKESVLKVSTPGDISVEAQGDIAATAGNKATVDAPLIEMNEGTGVITEKSICHFTGNPHNDGSSTVKAGK